MADFENDIPEGFIWFLWRLEYTQAVTFCLNNNFDVLDDIQIDNCHFLVFFDADDYQ